MSLSIIVEKGKEPIPDDGINDKIFIQSNSKITEVNAFRIIDRWGSIVFEDFQFMPNDSEHGWDGTFSGKQLNPGVYAYRVEMESEDGEVITMNGDITLLR